MATRQALFRFDAGLLFVAAGLALCAAAVLMPAQRDLFSLQQQLDELRRQDEQMHARLRITEEVILELDRNNPDLYRRLVSSQLNLAPAGDTPIMLVTSQQPDVSEWISARVRSTPPAPQRTAWPDSMLDRLVNGPYRLWILGGSVLCVFIGLMHGTGTSTRRNETRHQEEPTDSVQAAAHALPGKADSHREHPFRAAANDSIQVTDAADRASEMDLPSEFDAENDWCEITTVVKRDAPQTAPAKPADPQSFPKSLFDTTE